MPAIALAKQADLLNINSYMVSGQTGDQLITDWSGKTGHGEAGLTRVSVPRRRRRPQPERIAGGPSATVAVFKAASARAPMVDVAEFIKTQQESR